MKTKLFFAGALLLCGSASQAQPVEEYPSIVLSASFNRDFHIDQLAASASIAGRSTDAMSTTPSMRPVSMLAAEWHAGPHADDYRITLMGVPVDSRHRLDAAGGGESNWGWWALGGVGAALIAVVAISAGGGGDSHPAAPANCTNSTGVGPASVQNCQ